MIRLSEVRARIEARVPALKGRLGHGGDFAELVERNQVPTNTPAGFVLMGGLQGGAADIAVGLFRQGFAETVIVVLVDRHAADPSGERAMDQLTPLVRATIEAVVGWGPDETPGVFVLSSAELVGVKQGALVVQIDFQLNDQLRITP